MASRVNPAHANAHNNLGLLRIQRGALAGAEESLWAALQGHPGNAGAHKTF